MKLKLKQAAVLATVKELRKAAYGQATANGGNGRTLGYLVEQHLLSINPPKKADQPVTYSITKEGTAALKETAKAQPKAVIA